MAFLPPLCVAVVLAGPFLLSQSPAPPRDRPRPLEAPTTGVLAGRVTNDAGEPARDLVVQAVRFTFGDTGRRLSSVRLAGARTDDLGRYRIHDLPAGDYFVSAAPDPFAPVVRAPLQARPSGIARTYYPGTTQLREARRVTLAAGQEIVSLDFAVERVILGIITGRVVDSAGRPAVVGCDRDSAGRRPARRHPRRWVYARRHRVSAAQRAARRVLADDGDHAVAGRGAGVFCGPRDDRAGQWHRRRPAHGAGRDGRRTARGGRGCAAFDAAAGDRNRHRVQDAGSTGRRPNRAGWPLYRDIVVRAEAAASDWAPGRLGAHRHLDRRRAGDHGQPDRSKRDP